MPFKENPLDAYTYAYSHSGDFPESAVKRIPPSLLKVIDGGNHVFFEHLEHKFQNTYEALVNYCPQIELLELIVRSPLADGSERQDSVFFWGCEKEKKLITAGIPYFDPENLKHRKRQEKYYWALPEEMGVFYTKFNGMAISTGLGMEVLDLPNEFSLWQNIRDFYVEQGIALSFANELIGRIGGVDLRVLCKFRNDDFLIADLGNVSQTIYFVEKKNPVDMVMIRNTRCLDHYFAKAILDPGAEIFFGEFL